MLGSFGMPVRTCNWAGNPAEVRKELVEIITHLAFYSGWPTAASAIKLLNALPAQNQAV